MRFALPPYNFGMEYCKTAEERLKGEQKQIKLF